MSNSQPIRIALFGYGAIADMHATALTKLGATIVAVAGPRLEEVHVFADRHGIPRTESDVMALVGDPGVEAILVASPNDAHAGQVGAALQAGHHVLCEIPLALDAGEARTLAAAATTRGKVLMVCHTLRYWDPLVAARRIIEERSLVPCHVVARSLAFRHTNVGWTGRQRTWTDDLLWHHGAHVVDAATWLMGSQVVEVASGSGPLGSDGRAMDYSISLRTDDGCVASIALSYNARIATSDYMIVCDDDTLMIEGLTLSSHQNVLFEWSTSEDLLERAIRAQDEDFLSAVTSGSTPRSSASAILPAMDVLQRVHDQSATSGRSGEH